MARWTKRRWHGWIGQWLWNVWRISWILWLRFTGLPDGHTIQSLSTRNIQNRLQTFLHAMQIRIGLLHFLPYQRLPLRLLLWYKFVPKSLPMLWSTAVCRSHQVDMRAFSSLFSLTLSSMPLIKSICDPSRKSSAFFSERIFTLVIPSNDLHGTPLGRLVLYRLPQSDEHRLPYKGADWLRWSLFCFLPHQIRFNCFNHTWRRSLHAWWESWRESVVSLE